MVFFLFALLVGLIGGIYSNILVNRASKQFIKYDKANSDVLCADVDEFVSKVKKLDGFDIKNVSKNDGGIIVECKNASYNIRVENDVAFVEYDTKGCGFKISRIGRTIRIFKIAKACLKAAVINGIMDRISGKDTNQYEKDCKKINSGIKTMMIFFVGMLVCLCIGIFSIGSQQNDKAVETVKATEFDTGITYGEILDGYLEEQKWTAFVTDNYTLCVQVDGQSIQGESVIVQFLGDLGMEFNNIELQDFTPNYVGVDGEGYDPYSAMSFMCEFVYN